MDFHSPAHFCLHRHVVNQPGGLLLMCKSKGAMDNFRKALSMDPSLEYSKTKLDELLQEEN